MAVPYRNTNNPTKDMFDAKNLQRLAQTDPIYYQYLTSPDTFDYSLAPSGVMAVDPKGKKNQFTVNWDAITKPYKDKQAADAKAKADAEAAAAAAAHTGRISDARAMALRLANTEFGNLGLDPTQYTDQINQSINDVLASLAPDADPYSVLNGTNIADTISNGALMKARNQYGNQVQSAFGPNYGDKAISSSLLDDTINQILGEQQTAAQKYLDAGKARGIYNDIGYQGGEQEINKDAASARSNLSTLGRGVLDTYRTRANTIASNAANAASGYNLGGTFNLDDYIGQGNKLTADATSHAGDDLRAAVGGNNYFNLSDINQFAGQAQGATNLRDDNLTAALAYRKAQQDKSRGLGSQGAF